jgi:hypothetical protein
MLTEGALAKMEKADPAVLTISEENEVSSRSATLKTILAKLEGLRLDH